MKLTALYLLGLLSIAAPHVCRVLGYEVGIAPSVAATSVGVALLVIATLLLVFSRLYRRTKASEAFVRR